MRSSKSSAHGNIYLLVEDERLTAERARELSADASSDGVLEVLTLDGAEVAIAVWNPDGSHAEMSGNGTRIASRWLAERSGSADVVVRVGDRATRARVDGDLVEQALGAIEIGPRETVEGIEVT